LSGREIRDYVADMSRYAETAVRLVEGTTLEDLAADERTSLALERAIEILGEAASRIPPEWRARHPDPPWREMIGTRHRLAHGYFATELFILHEIATLLLPPLLPRLRELAASA
jgi:uncharacterized protein with HEPN domain